MCDFHDKYPDVELVLGLGDRPVDMVQEAVDCVIRAATGEESSTLVNRPYGAKLTVASGVELYVSNCVFEAVGNVLPVSVSGGV